MNCETIKPDPYWHCIIPTHVAGSSGNRSIGKVQASAEEIHHAFDHCATIDDRSHTVSFYKRPKVEACKFCNGSGNDPNSNDECPRCSGSGVEPSER